MSLIIVVALLLLVGTWLLLRSPAPAPHGSEVTADDQRHVRDAVRERLQERLVGWTFETTDEPAELIAVQAATDARRTLRLDSVVPAWKAMRERGADQDADAVIEAFVVAATGEGGAQPVDDEDPTGHEWARHALGVRLGREAPAPGTIARPALGGLQAQLVVRSPAGAEPVTAADLDEWGLREDEAFRVALANLHHDVEEGLRLEPFDGPPDAPDALKVAPGDPIAASYALVPSLADALGESFADGVSLWVVAPGVLVAARADWTPPAHLPAQALVTAPVLPAAPAWA